MHNIISNMKTRIDPDDNRHRGFKFKIYPNEKQKKIIHRNFIGAHYAYNRALDYFIEYEDTYKDIPEDVKIDKGIIFTSERDMYSKFVKPDMDNDPNVENPTVSVIRSAIHNFYQAIDNYRNIPGYNRPRYKTTQSRMSYTFKADNLNITGDSIRIEGIPDHIPCENIGDRLPLKLSSGNVKYGVLKFCIPTISFDGTNYWFGVSVQYPGVITRISSNLSERTKAIGIDVGLNTTATCSNGMIFHTPMGDKHRKRLKRLRKRANKHYYKPMLDEEFT